MGLRSSGEEKSVKIDSVKIRTGDNVVIKRKRLLSALALFVMRSTYIGERMQAQATPPPQTAHV